MSGYTVIDVETTGLSPRQYDRIVEIAAVSVSETGQSGMPNPVSDQWKRGPDCRRTQSVRVFEEGDCGNPYCGYSQLSMAGR